MSSTSRIFLVSIFGNVGLDTIIIGAIKTFKELYLRKIESPPTIKLNDLIRKNKAVLSIFNIWDLRSHKIQATVLISNIGNTFFNFATF